MRSSRDAEKGSRDNVPCGVWGNAPTAPRVTSMLNALNKRRRQRSVPATNFARPQTRPQAAHSTTCTLSRQMGATDQHRETIPVLVFFIAGDFASADATRGLSARTLDPFPCLTLSAARETNFPKKAKTHPDNPLVQERIAGMLAYHRITRTPLQMPQRTPGKTKCRTMQSCRSSP